MRPWDNDGGERDQIFLIIPGSNLQSHGYAGTGVFPLAPPTYSFSIILIKAGKRGRGRVGN